MISTMQVLKILKTNYSLEASRELVFKYSSLGLITPELRREGQPGKSLGVKTYWPDSTPGKIFCIKELMHQNFKLPEIAELYQMFKQGVLNYFAPWDLNSAKVYHVAAYLLAAETDKIDLLSLKAMQLEYEGYVPDHDKKAFPDDPPAFLVIKYKLFEEVRATIKYQNGLVLVS